MLETKNIPPRKEVIEGEKKSIRLVAVTPKRPPPPRPHTTTEEKVRMWEALQANVHHLQKEPRDQRPPQPSTRWIHSPKQEAQPIASPTQQAIPSDSENGQTPSVQPQKRCRNGSQKEIEEEEQEDKWIMVDMPEPTQDPAPVKKVLFADESKEESPTTDLQGTYPL